MSSSRHRRSKQRRQKQHATRTIIELLSDSYTDEGIDIWLRARNRNLNMRRPIDLIVEGQIDTVIDEAKWVAGGM